MCRLCLSRRGFLAAPAVLPWASDVPVEPHMRLATPAGFTVALTLDACPGAFDQRIASALVESGIPATIFVTDLWMRRNPVGLAFFLAHRDVFSLQNHGARHIPPVLGRSVIYGIPVAGDMPTIQRDVVDGGMAISRAGGDVPTWYRASTGYYSRSAIPVIQQLGFGIAGFSLNADQGASLSAAGVASRIGRAVSGDVIIAHINQPDRPSGAGVVQGVRALQGRGARFVRLDQFTTADFVTERPLPPPS